MDTYQRQEPRQGEKGKPKWYPVDARNADHREDEANKSQDEQENCEHEAVYRVMPQHQKGKLMIQKCDDCQRERTEDDFDYSPMQVIIVGSTIGWFSGEDGDFCGECLTRMLRKANG